MSLDRLWEHNETKQQEVPQGRGNTKYANLERPSCSRIWQWARAESFQTQTPSQICHIMCRLACGTWQLLVTC